MVLLWTTVESLSSARMCGVVVGVDARATLGSGAAVTLGCGAVTTLGSGAVVTLG